jgi:hypothetical protein
VTKNYLQFVIQKKRNLSVAYETRETFCKNTLMTWDIFVFAKIFITPNFLLKYVEEMSKGTRQLAEISIFQKN